MNPVAGRHNQQRLLNDKFGELIGAVTQIALSMSLPARPGAENLDLLLNGVCAIATTPQQAAKVLDRVLRDVVRPHHHGLFWGDRLLTLDKSTEFRDDPAFQAALQEATARQEPTSTSPQTAFAGDTIR